MLGSNDASESATSATPPMATCGAELCLHCGNPLPAAARDAFCCGGCRAVHGLLAQAGLLRFYALRADAVLPPAALPASARVDRNWVQPLVTELAAATGSIELSVKLQGLRCAACVWLIQQLFGRHVGAHRILINSARATAKLCVDSRFPLAQFAAELEPYGYILGEVGPEQASNDGLLLRTGFCIALSFNAMMFSAAIYFGLREGPLFRLLHGLDFACASLAVLIGAPVFMRSAFTALRQRVVHLDLPIAVGIALGYGAVLWSYATGRVSAAYYDSLSIFIALMLLGRWLKDRILLANRRELLGNDGLSSLRVRRVQGDSVALVPATELRAGDVLLVPPGDLIPVAATLLDERAACSLDWIRGESEPAAYCTGSVVPAGAFNAGSAPLRLRCESDFEGSRLVELLAAGAREPVPTREQHGFALAYVVAVLGAGALSLAYWAQRAGVVRGLEVATAVYVVTCPCAIGIAVPFAHELVLTGLRRAGLFVRTPSFLVRARAVRSVVFDKTGTLTTGRLGLQDAAPLAALGPRERDVLYTLASASGHPKSRAVAVALDAQSARLLPYARVVELPAQGAELELAGQRYRFGRPSWAASPAAEGCDCDLAFGVDGSALCRLSTCEQPRADARSELANLERDGYQTFILSGDEPARVRALAAQVGVPAQRALGQKAPADKAAWIAAHDHADLLMIGDGVNDALAVARAFTSGTPSIDRAIMPSRTDFYFVTPGLAPIRLALRASHALARVLRRNQVFAVLYNVAAIALAAIGVMRPWLAAVLMPLSSVVVLTTTSVSLSARSSIWTS